ncbi:hypothetical protein Dimus_029585 [Dionaea muscipula]
MPPLPSELRRQAPPPTHRISSQPSWLRSVLLLLGSCSRSWTEIDTLIQGGINVLAFVVDSSFDLSNSLILSPIDPCREGLPVVNCSPLLSPLSFHRWGILLIFFVPFEI